jgi:threonine dehydrogenase-like Zn-dependent dehydrogenase
VQVGADGAVDPAALVARLAVVPEAGEDAPERLADLTGGDLFDLVFDATGSAAAMERSFGLVAHGGTLVLVGVVRTDLRFSDPELHKRELTVRASRNATAEDFAQVLDAVRSGRVDAGRLVTHTAALDDAPGRFPEWISPASGVVKAMVEM